MALTAAWDSSLPEAARKGEEQHWGGGCHCQACKGDEKIQSIVAGINKASKGLSHPGHDPIPPLTVRPAFDSRVAAITGYADLMHRRGGNDDQEDGGPWEIREEPSGIVVAERQYDTSGVMQLSGSDRDASTRSGSPINPGPTLRERLAALRRPPSPKRAQHIMIYPVAAALPELGPFTYGQRPRPSLVQLREQQLRGEVTEYSAGR
jgi:hypothetical protein